MPYKLAVVGSRTVSDRDALYKVLNSIETPSLLVSGGAKGADMLSEDWASLEGVPTLIIKPDWEKDGKGAGFKRNRYIIEACDKVIAFWDGESRGTINSINWAISLSKECRIIYTKIPNFLPAKKWNGDIISGFSNDWRWLSNMWPARIKFRGVTFQCSESAYQASKFSSDKKTFNHFSSLTGVDAKKESKKYVEDANFKNVRLETMYEIVKIKFSYAPLKKMLCLTKDADIIESNTWGDTFWGVCDGEGENHLGLILKRIRNEFCR